MTLLLALTLAGGMADPIPLPENPPPLLYECPSRPGVFYKPGHAILCQEDQPGRGKRIDRLPPTECTDAGDWAPGARFALGDKPKKECA